MEEQALVSLSDNERALLDENRKLHERIAALELEASVSRGIADATYDWEYWIDSFGHLRYTSPSSWRITGYSREELYRTPSLLVDMICPEDRGRLLCLKGDLRIDEVELVELRILSKSGQVVWIEHICHPFIGEKAEYLGRRASNRDITRKRSMDRGDWHPAKQDVSLLTKDMNAFQESRKESTTGQEELKRTLAEIQETIKGLEEEVEEQTFLNEQLIRKNEELEEFSLKVSHELKNNLLMIKRTMEMAEASPDFLQRNARFIAEGSNRLVEFVSRTLKLARSGKDVDEMLECALDCLVREIFDQMKPESLAGELIIEEGFPLIWGDPQGMKEVFSNLLGNSFEHRDAAKEKVIIELQAKQERGYISITYRDNGMGIAEEHVGKLFDAGFTTKEKEGFGFGMAIAKKIMEAHGGSIEALSKGRGQGAEFVISIPHRSRK
jgi:two-component system, chemotaxis family, sensor kinase Cph1